MPTAYLGMNTQVGTGSTVQVKRYNGLSSSLVGTAFGSGETALAGAQPINRVIQFGSQNTFLALSNNTISRSTDAGATWTTVHTLSGPAGSTVKTGLNVVFVNGVPTVCCMWMNSAFTLVFGSYSTDGITWTNSSGTGFGGNSFIKDTVFRNSLYMYNAASLASTGIIYIYTPGATTPTGVTVPGSEFGGALCVFNDTLMYSGVNSGAATRNLYALDGSLILKATYGTGFSGATATSYTGMFVDSNSGNLIIFNRKSIPGGWGCWSIDSNYAFTDISSTVLPGGMLDSTLGVNSRVETFVDGGSNPGSNPDKYVIFVTTNTAGTPRTMYKWEGISTPMTNIDSGSNVQEALSISNNCQGVNLWTSGEISVGLVSRTPVSGGIRLNFNLYSTGGATIVNVRALYGTQMQEYPLTLATISNNSNGAISLNVNTGLTADNGATTYYFTWNSITDGVDPGDRFRLILEASV